MQDEISPNRLSGMLLGAAVGDALGLPREGLSRSRAARLFPGPLRHRLLFGSDMVSDDTEHLLITAQSLLDAPDDVAACARRLAWRLRGWFLQLSPGLGLATAKACLKLCCGFSKL
ncbi:MAG: ADP-ribosylglycohydrolase family protein [Zoogloeaceae bacterium]|jgi:ADP-ribosylglycohydrolase|nr:ADP-ribosylglycohydrolase family protein [Zoogloeaceae bacterium]